MKQTNSFFTILWAVSLLAACSSSATQNADMLADLDPIEMGTTSVEFDKIFSSSLAQKEIKLFFDPRINSVFLEFKYQSVYYRQYWNKTARDAFISAVERYRADYEAKALLLKDSKTRAAYGKIKGRILWSSLNVSLAEKSYADPIFEIGYTFKKDNPYFSVLQLEAKAITENKNSPSKTSLRIRTYFTRDQASGLAAFFDDNYLMGLLRDYAKPENNAFSPDNYDEQEVIVTPPPSVP